MSLPQYRLIALTAFLSSTTTAFTITASPKATTQLQMGLFDGVKDAFSAPPSSLDAERETPIDRWMGWSVAKDDETEEAKAQADAAFVDSMDSENYVTVELTKPMGIIFEENDEEMGGIFVQSLLEDGAASQHGVLKEGDQLVAVDGVKVSGKSFDNALETIMECEKSPTPLLLFRGTSEQLYGPTGASQEWLDEFIKS